MRASRFALIVGAGLMALSGVALAQVAPTVIIPQPTINQHDVVTGACQGVPTAQMCGWTPSQVNGVEGYVKAVPVTGFSYTYGNSQVHMTLNPAGTLATGTLVTAPNPSDGQRECVLSTQTQTALTVTPNSGQFINNPPTALTANVPVCWEFSKNNATWDRSP